MKIDKFKIVLLISLCINLLFLFWVIKKYLIIHPEEVTFSQSQMFYSKDRVSQFSILNKRNIHRILLVGDSMFDRFCVEDFFSGMNVYNRGIGYETTTSLLDRIDHTVLNAGAKTVFLYIGTNDLAQEVKVDDIGMNIKKISEKLNSSRICVNIFSILPRGKVYGERKGWNELIDINKKTTMLNKILKEQFKNNNVFFWDITKKFTDKHGVFLDSSLSNDGTHLNGNGYIILESEIKEIIKKQLNNAWL